jgi:hypothetical protein
MNIRFNEFHALLSLDAYLFPSPFDDEVVEDESGDHDRREQTGYNADAQGHGESLDRARAELEKDQGCNQGGDVGVRIVERASSLFARFSGIKQS